MKKYDLIVVGGGFAGVSATIAAARKGLSTLLVERGNSLGGCATSSLVEPFMPVVTKIDGKKTLLTRGLFLEYIQKLFENERQRVENFYEYLQKEVLEPEDYSGCNFLIDDEYLKLMLNSMVLESGAEILFHSFLTDAIVHNGHIDYIVVANKSGKLELSASYYIDATGDADLAYLSGCEFVLGRETDNLCQPMSLGFRLAGVDVEKYKETYPQINELYREHHKKGLIKNPKNDDIQMFYNYAEGVLHCNSTRVVRYNPTDAFDVTKAEIEAREQVYELYHFLKNNAEAFKDCKVIKTASYIGVRESRKIVGEYVLTGMDLKNCVMFEDSIAIANYDLDIHDPEGGGVSHYFFKEGEYYSVPYRSLIPKEINNLAVAGKCISATHEAQASIRVMPIVCCLGEAAGVACSIANTAGCSMKDVNISELQKQLVENGAKIR